MPKIELNDKTLIPDALLNTGQTDDLGASQGEKNLYEHGLNNLKRALQVKMIKLDCMENFLFDDYRPEGKINV